MHRLRGDAATATEAHRRGKHLSSSEMRRLREVLPLLPRPPAGSACARCTSAAAGVAGVRGPEGGGLFTSKVLEIEDVL